MNRQACMTHKFNLRFLLALGNQKVVIMQQQDEVQVFTGQDAGRPNVSASRLCEAVESK